MSELDDEIGHAEADVCYREAAKGRQLYHLMDVCAGDVLRWLDELARLRAIVSAADALRMAAGDPYFKHLIERRALWQAIDAYDAARGPRE